MGVGFSVKASCCELMQPTLAKARKKFWADKEVICGPGPLSATIKYFDKVVTGSALWCLLAIIPDRQALMMVNAHLYVRVGWMMTLKGRPGEDWLGCHIRTLRAARAAVQRVMGERWSTKWLRWVWKCAGQRIRGGDRVHLPASTIISHYGTGPWWKEQQADPNGLRHSGRFLPKLSIHEGNLGSICKGPWRDTAHDRCAWKGPEEEWIAIMDVPWASGSQSMLSCVLWIWVMACTFAALLATQV